MTLRRSQYSKSSKRVKAFWLSLRRESRAALVLILISLSVVAALWVFVKGDNGGATQIDAPWHEGQMIAFSFAEKRQVVAPSPFFDASGSQYTLADFRGKVLLVNLWATWCVPCLEEMPTLDRLQGVMAGDDFEVLAISVDKAGAEKSREFLEDLEVEHLDLYVDPTMNMNFKMSVFGLPTTLLLDRKGQEIGRLTGTTQWDSAEVRTFLQHFIDQG
jgi:thiol-disulfide isomerase/thioredoxin